MVSKFNSFVINYIIPSSCHTTQFHYFILQFIIVFRLQINLRPIGHVCPSWKKPMCLVRASTIFLPVMYS
jgi:hypothetical protein